LEGNKNMHGGEKKQEEENEGASILEKGFWKR
jgi:hypothetical protein